MAASTPSISVPIPPAAYQQRAQIPSLVIPKAGDLGKSLLPAAIGGALTVAIISATYPRHGTIAAMLSGAAGGLLAGTAPLLSIPQEIGLGAFLAAGTWLTLRAINEIPSTPATVAAVADIPPVDLGNGAQLAFTRRVA